MNHLQLTINVDDHFFRLLDQEDTNHDGKITVQDEGPKSFELISTDGKHQVIKGCYSLSVLLQILGRAKDEGLKTCKVNLADIYSSPVEWINQQITKYHWEALTRRFDREGIYKLIEDSKHDLNKQCYLYVPQSDPNAKKYWTEFSNQHPELNLDILCIPKELSGNFLLEMRQKPGLLNLSLKSNPPLGNPFVVPGGRFNELYGWDSYFIIEGLLLCGRVELAQSIFEHLIYEIEHYGQVLNANRSYYLMRSNPPFLSSILKKLIQYSAEPSLIERGLNAIINEYFLVWMNQSRRVSEGLSRYYGMDKKEPIEVEPDHFDFIYQPFAKKLNISSCEYRDKYLSNQISEPTLDQFFIHDSSMRESGHDTTYRLIDKSAHLCPVDLNSLLYRYELDIASIIEKYFEGVFVDHKQRRFSSQEWLDKAKIRQQHVNDFLWCEKQSMYLDYDFESKKQHSYQSATTFYPLFASLASKEQANKLINQALPKFEALGGIVSSTKESRGAITKNHPLRQWDYPFGWAPHQILLWKGCLNYGYTEIAQRLAYKWLYMISVEAKNYNGALTEKYDVCDISHQVTAEYGNIGKDFKYYSKGGFGWTNASFLIGQKVLNQTQLAALKSLKPPKLVFK